MAQTLHALAEPSQAEAGHAAMPYAELPAFVATLTGMAGYPVSNKLDTGNVTQLENMSALALRFTILTVSRAGEAIGARWSEIDFASKLWTIPAARMKMRCTHRVPLSEPAIEILGRLQETSVNDFVFSGLAPNAMFMLLRRTGKGQFTVHGFRSSFRDWAGNETAHARETCEAALAHASGDATEQAYRRGDALEKRRLLMCDWANFLTKKEESFFKDSSLGVTQSLPL